MELVVIFFVGTFVGVREWFDFDGKWNTKDSLTQNSNLLMCAAD